MYKNNKTFYPKDIYKINFDNIKKSFAFENYRFEDYGSIVTMENDNYAISINNMGKVQFFYDYILQKDLITNVKKIEDIFKEQIKEFSININ